MAANVLQPYGLSYSRNKIGAAPTVQNQVFTIKSGYNAAIGFGDIVVIGTSGNQGYVTIAGDNPAAILGVFMGVLPYFDKTFQQTVHGGLMGSYQTTANPSGDISCLVCTDPFAVFRAQVSGGPFAQTWVGNNINWVAGTNGTPGSNGLSVLVLDGASPATTNTFPFRVEGVVGVTGGPQDPANTNPWLEISFNPGIAQMLQSTGI